MIYDEKKKQIITQELLKIEEEVTEIEEKQNELDLKLGVIIQLKKMKNLEELQSSAIKNGLKIGETLEEQLKFIEEEFENVLIKQNDLKNEAIKIQERTEKLLTL